MRMGRRPVSPKPAGFVLGRRRSDLQPAERDNPLTRAALIALGAFLALCGVVFGFVLLVTKGLAACLLAMVIFCGLAALCMPETGHDS